MNHRSNEICTGVIDQSGFYSNQHIQFVHREKAPNSKIRVAYLWESGFDTEYANRLTLILSKHNKNRFEVIGLSTGAPLNDKGNLLLKQVFDYYVDAAHLNDIETANLLREMGIDIAINLLGDKATYRATIFANRCAPIQVHFPSKPVSSGARFFDYILASQAQIPIEYDVYFSEQIVYLPTALERCTGCAAERSRDIAHYRDHLEKAYQIMWTKLQQAQPAVSFRVNSSDDISTVTPLEPESAQQKQMHVALILSAHGEVAFGIHQLSLSVFESIKQLDIKASFGINEVSDSCANIILGGENIPLAMIEHITPDSIVLNTLEIATATQAQKNHLIQLCQRFQVWDYNQRNLGWLTQHLNTEHLAYIPIGFSSQTHKQANTNEHLIDVLLLSNNIDKRSDIAAQLLSEGIQVIQNTDMSSEALADQISSAKVICLLQSASGEDVNLPMIGYLLGIGKPVVVECNDPHDIEKVYQRAANFVTTSELVNTSVALAKNDTERVKRAEQGHKLFVHLSQADMIASALNIA